MCIYIYNMFLTKLYLYILVGEKRVVVLFFPFGEVLFFWYG